MTTEAQRFNLHCQPVKRRYDDRFKVPGSEFNALRMTARGDENEKRTGIVNPLNSASTHTVTSFSRFDFCSSFCTNFQGIYRLLPPPKG
jgi:hypothetical protein